MNASSWAVCSAFLNGCLPDQKSALLKYLSDELVEQLQAQAVSDFDPAKSYAYSEESLEDIHYSWIAPHLRNLPEKEIAIFLKALSPKQAKELKSLLGFSGDLPDLTPFALTFFKEILYKKITNDEPDLLPAGLLPKSPLNSLVSLKSRNLTKLIEFLGVHDIAVEIRHIIETSKLKKIHEVLSSEEKSYLKILLQSREPVIFTTIGLGRWNGDKVILREIMLQRGLNRLAKALYGQHPSLIWHIVHQIDVDKALLLKKLSVSLENPKATKLLISQILELFSFMRQHDE